MPLQPANPVPDNGVPPASPPGPLTGALGSVQKKAIGNSSFLINPALAAVSLNNTALDPPQVITPGAVSAVFVCEADPANTNFSGGPIARYWTDGTWPSTIAGLPIYDGVPIELQGAADLANFRCISADGYSPSFNIQYFSAL